MIFPYIPYTLHNLIKSNVYLTTVEVKKVLFQIICGIKYISSKGVMHRDIKPENILISENLQDIKICDFGSAYKVPNQETTQNHKLSHHVVTRYYRPP